MIPRCIQMSPIRTVTAVPLSSPYHDASTNQLNNSLSHMGITTEMIPDDFLLPVPLLLVESSYRNHHSPRPRMGLSTKNQSVREISNSEDWDKNWPSYSKAAAFDSHKEQHSSPQIEVDIKLYGETRRLRHPGFHRFPKRRLRWRSKSPHSTTTVAPSYTTVPPVTPSSTPITTSLTSPTTTTTRRTTAVTSVTSPSSKRPSSTTLAPSATAATGDSQTSLPFSQLLILVTLATVVAMYIVVVGNTTTPNNDDSSNDGVDDDEGSDVISPARDALLATLPAVILGASLPSDGCPRDEVMVGGVCSPLLESVPPCPPPQWVVLNATVDPPEGSCGTRLCGRGRVFLVSDQLCHDVREPGLCPDDKRMYITAYGSPVCDCYEGEFPDVSGKCHPLFSQGPCPAGELWGPSEDNTSFACEPQRCPSTDGGFAEVPFEDGICFLLGSQGPCAANEILGFSISRAKAVCTTLEEAGYEIPFERVRELDELYPRFAPPRFQVDFAEIFNNRIVKRQVGNLVSDPVIPNINLNVAPNPGTILQTPLLTQCRPGAQLDVNFKCRDIIIGPNVDPTTRGMHAPPVPPLQSCPSNLCFDDRAQCVTCDQAVVNTCALSASLNLQQTSCQALSVGLG